MNVVSIVGARPQFIKVAPISWNSKDKFHHQIIHTGQHYDPEMSRNIFESLRIPVPVVQLITGSGSHAEQTGKMIIEIEKSLLDLKPDHVIIYGDTNSTLAGALAASKLQIPISHIEAGLRSWNRLMPEEINRIVSDHISNLLFAPTLSSLNNLRNEGLEDKSYLVGDIMVETINFIRDQISSDSVVPSYIFATIHRVENTADSNRVKYIIEKFRESPIPIHLYCHPRLKKVLDELSLSHNSKNLIFLPPLKFEDSIRKISKSIGVVTDSGGVQKEAYILGKPCLIARAETEWVETLDVGTSFLDPQLKEISNNWWNKTPLSDYENVFGDGLTSHKIIEQILQLK